MLLPCCQMGSRRHNSTAWPVWHASHSDLWQFNKASSLFLIQKTLHSWSQFFYCKIPQINIACESFGFQANNYARMHGCTKSSTKGHFCGTMANRNRSHTTPVRMARPGAMKVPTHPEAGGHSPENQWRHWWGPWSTHARQFVLMNFKPIPPGQKWSFQYIYIYNYIYIIIYNYIYNYIYIYIEFVNIYVFIHIYIYANRPGYNSNGSFEHVLTWLSTAFTGGFHTVEETERVPSRSKSHMENLGRTWRSKAETTKPVAPSMKILRSVFKESKTMATMGLSTYIIVCHRGAQKIIPQEFRWFGFWMGRLLMIYQRGPCLALEEVFRSGQPFNEDTAHKVVKPKHWRISNYIWLYNIMYVLHFWNMCI